MPATSSRRTMLQHVAAGQTEHAGLWLDRFVASQDRDDTASRRVLVSDVAAMSRRADSEAYQQFFQRWLGGLGSINPLIVGTARVRGRLAVGLGAEGVIETAITLHRTYGMPYIPGSALKGLAAAYAHQHLGDPRWRKKTKDAAIGEAHKVMFGDTSCAGYVTFFDALYVPGSGFGGQALYPDVLTVHHRDYYQGGATLQPPADWDSPTPVPFLSATGSYLVAVGGPAAWAERALEILQKALASMGVGAKTSSGYGRMDLTKALLASMTQQVEATNATPNPIDSKPLAMLPTPQSEPSEPKKNPDPSSRIPAIGDIVSGQKKNKVRIGTIRGAGVSIQKHGDTLFVAPQNLEIIGVDPSDPSAKPSGGFRGRVVQVERQDNTIYLVLERVKREQ